MPEETRQPILQINQNLIVAIAIAGAVLAIVLYYENKKMREQLFMLAPTRRPCNCHEQSQTVTSTLYDQEIPIVNHSPDPAVMPNNQKPPEVVVD